MTDVKTENIGEELGYDYAYMDEMRKQTKLLKTIRNVMLFFTIIVIAGIMLSIIAGYAIFMLMNLGGLWK